MWGEAAKGKQQCINVHNRCWDICSSLCDNWWTWWAPRLFCSGSWAMVARCSTVISITLPTFSPRRNKQRKGALYITLWHTLQAHCHVEFLFLVLSTRRSIQETIYRMSRIPETIYRMSWPESLHQHVLLFRWSGRVATVEVCGLRIYSCLYSCMSTLLRVLKLAYSAAIR